MSNHVLTVPSPAANPSIAKVKWLFAGLLSFAGLVFPIGCPNSATTGNGGGNSDTVRLRLVADGLVAPVGLAIPPDNSNRIFVVDQIGKVRIIESSGHVIETPFLDLRDRLVEIMPAYDERGLLGMAFHPNFAENGRFFVVYNAPPPPDGGDVGYPIDSLERVSEFRVSDQANIADPSSERILLELAKPQFNHNGGQLAFGTADGFLYVSVGDGGGANDVGDGHNSTIGNAQDGQSLFGKILRIDVDHGNPYAVPENNPFTGNPAYRPEIWALGLRNPWRFSLDRQNPERIFIADVGQELFEEVDLGVKGANYGWHVREGTHCFSAESATEPPSSCTDVGANGGPLVGPLFDYSHINDAGEVIRTSIIGGYVYRGANIPGLAGQYVFGDYSSGFEGTGDGTLLAARENANGKWSLRELGVENNSDARIHLFVRGFGEDSSGELYVLTTSSLGPIGATGAVYKIEPISD